jgi:hypothetical protein
MLWSYGVKKLTSIGGWLSLHVAIMIPSLSQCEQTQGFHLQ